jgi:hypothetical protein
MNVARQFPRGPSSTAGTARKGSDEAQGAIRLAATPIRAWLPQERAMRQWKFIAVILIAPMAVVAAHAQDKGDTVTPKASEPARQDYVTSTGATPRQFAEVVW